MEEDVATFIKQCLHCIDSTAGELKSRPLGEVLHGGQVGEVVQFDFLYIEKAATDEGLTERAEKYLLVMVEAIRGYIQMEPVVACTAEITA